MKVKNLLWALESVQEEEKGKVDGFLCPLVERFFMSLWGLTVGPDTNKRREREPDG